MRTGPTTRRTLGAAIALIGVLGTAFAGDTPADAVPTRTFAASSSMVTAAELGATWHPGCPVGPSSLRLLHLSYLGFNGREHIGTMVVAASVVTGVEQVFRTLFRSSFPIRSMQPEASFAGSDPRSMAADNTSGFNCRTAVASGPPRWSVHAYGEAIDVNPVENPYLYNGKADPPEGAPFLDRHDVRPGMAVAGGILVKAFAAVGWFWGGRWAASPDYQHFSATGG